jgi:hypothetical protein
MSKNKTELIVPEFFEGQIYTKGEEVTNPFSGEAIYLDPISLSIYDFIKGCEAFSNSGMLSKGIIRDFDMSIDWFIKNNPEAYMILLD